MIESEKPLMNKEDSMSYSVWAFCAWTSVLGLGLISSVCSLTALRVSKFHDEITGSVELPVFSKLFLTGFTGIYLVTYIPILWLVSAQVRDCGANQLRILTIVTLSFSILFLALFICSLILPLTSLVVSTKE